MMQNAQPPLRSNELLGAALRETECRCWIAFHFTNHDSLFLLYYIISLAFSSRYRPACV